MAIAPLTFTLSVFNVFICTSAIVLFLCLLTISENDCKLCSTCSVKQQHFSLKNWLVNNQGDLWNPIFIFIKLQGRNSAIIAQERDKAEKQFCLLLRIASKENGYEKEQTKNKSFFFLLFSLFYVVLRNVYFCSIPLKSPFIKSDCFNFENNELCCQFSALLTLLGLPS